MNTQPNGAQTRADNPRTPAEPPPGMRISVTVWDGRIALETSVELSAGQVSAKAFAEAVLRGTIATASLIGSDYTWAAIERFAAFDGVRS